MKAFAVAVTLAAVFLCGALAAKAGPTIASENIKVIESRVRDGNILPQFMFSQGSVEGGMTKVVIGGGRGTPKVFTPDDSNGKDIWEGAMNDTRSPQLPYLTQDQWTCDRKEEEFKMFTIESDSLKAYVSASISGKIWSMWDKKNQREVFFNNPAHQPANIGALKAWAAGGCEWNWSPGIIGHSAFSESPTFLAKINTDKGDVLRVYEFDRYNGTVWQVDMFIDDDELWVHPRITNPNPVDLRGYWWTCVAHHVTPESRVVSPANHVAETATGQLRDAPWPYMAEIFNTSFTGLAPPLGNYIWKQDHSFLGNVIWGDFFLRIPEDKEKYIMHVEKDGYSVYHGHELDGTKFFTWGQSGPGRFMQDFLSANAPDRMGDYAELQVGPAPTQMQSWPLPQNSVKQWTEFFKSWMPTAEEKSKLQHPDYNAALDATENWISSPKGVSQEKIRHMREWMTTVSAMPVKESDIISDGMPWGYLHERLRQRMGHPGRMVDTAFFRVPDNRRMREEIQPWLDLLDYGTFSNATLSRLPISYQVSEAWRTVIEDSATKVGTTWLHSLHLGVIAAETGIVDKPRIYFQDSMNRKPNAIAARCLALLCKTPDDAYPLFQKAWQLALNDTKEPSRDRLLLNLAAEITQFLQSQEDPKWLPVLEDFLQKLNNVPADVLTTDQVITSGIAVALFRGDYEKAISILKSNCFPTYGKARKELIAYWYRAQLMKAEKETGRPLTRWEQRQVRVGNKVPRNIGCPYAETYCDTYW